MTDPRSTASISHSASTLSGSGECFHIDPHCPSSFGATPFSVADTRQHLPPTQPQRIPTIENFSAARSTQRQEAYRLPSDQRNFVW